MIENIKEYVKKGYISFHTPAHKGRNKYINKILKSDYDLTELSETDNLFYESGCIKELEERLAKTYGAESLYLLVNGATSGVMAAANLFSENDKIIVDRNCHISFINALILNGATPVFIKTKLNEFNIPYPPTTEEIRKTLEENKDAKGLFITSVNYYGMGAELKEIAQICKEYGVISIADEAHGTHFYYNNEVTTASECGFDICILSFHKNLPSLTQTGGIIINNKDFKEKIKQNLRTFTSTSPSYLFMLSVDAMDRYMKDRGIKEVKKYSVYLKKIKQEISEKGIKILTSNDPFKFIINCKDAHKKAEIIKEKYKLVCEMSDSENATYIISIHNTKKEINLLKKAVIECMNEVCKENRKFILPKAVLTPKNAFNKESEFKDKNDAIGRISAEYIIDFPPSVPVIVPGELITKEILENIKKDKIRCIRE